MHGGMIQRIFSSGDAKKSCTLLKGFGAHARHFHQFFPRTESSVLCPVIDNVLCQLGAQTGYIGEQMTACRIEIYPDQVHAILYRLIECFLQLRLVYIVLVLTHADGLWIYLHQFCQRVHQAASDGDCPTHRYVVIRKLVTSNFGSRINGSPLLADYKHGYLTVETLTVDEIFRLPACRSVADGDGFYLVGLNHLAKFRSSLAGLVDRRMRIDILIMQQIALCIETNHLTSGTESGVDGEHPFLSQWRSEKKLAEVFGEYANCFIVGFLFGLGGKFCFDGRLEQPFVSIRRGFAHLPATFVVATYELAFQTFDAGLVVGIDRHFQQPFRLCPADGEQTVGRATFQWLGEIEIIAVFRCFFLFSFD